LDRTADRVIRFLVDHARCTSCGGRFALEHVHVLHEEDLRVWDLGAVCHECHTLTLVRAIVRPEPTDGNPTPIDAGAQLDELTLAERDRFAELGPVRDDDVLDMTAFLREFDGDFRGLFGRETEED
jgi:hypothetical protein